MASGPILQEWLTLVGPGRAGRALARSWCAAGGHLEGVIGRDRASAERGVREIPGGNPRALAEARCDCDILVLAVPDDAIAPVARALAGQVSCRVAFHLSGAFSSEALHALAQAGASTGSLHPLRAFTGATGESWRDALVAIEGEEEAVQSAEALTGAIGARAQRISSDGKALYHAAATLAAGGTVALLSLATRAWVEAGFSEPEARAALADLAAGAASAAVGQHFEDALTGAVARRDIGTIRAHREALRRSPEALQVYALLAEETIRQTPGRGHEEEIRTLIGRENKGGKR
jgi:predicted short-subunit dehydrogenase-like oxidoreductase (DUF2520 family)